MSALWVAAVVAGTFLALMAIVVGLIWALAWWFEQGDEIR